MQLRPIYYLRRENATEEIKSEITAVYDESAISSGRARLILAAPAKLKKQRAGRE
jgi:hypothetical protein